MDESAKDLCPSCGEPLHADDVYCGSCGRAVARPATNDAATDVNATKAERVSSGDAPTEMMPVTVPPAKVDDGADDALDPDPPLPGEAPPFASPPPPPSDAPLEAIAPAAAVAAAPAPAVPPPKAAQRPPSRNKGLKIALIVVS